MRILLIIVLIANALFEGLVGLLLVISPESAITDGSVAGITFATNYGFAALTVASVIAWCWKDKDNLRTMGVVLGILSTFHSALTVATAINMSTTGEPLPTIVHGIMALMCWVLFFNRKKWCSS
ncbi:hypothetical protein EYC98_15580 [Halieaceae bacterium IMCC14734]|uniref:Uncharacterized protein n=1 Tax=Candidatus Litorirhabdus singularis TaxID=2518993 RepID=A0ABT3TIY5_9GAMM|nr:hypothetical protein [Candidatus Litorirhabdus singularis]MCX2982283.1 hypothetical protein [Candidatus Litorirhabdus singularis]